MDKNRFLLKEEFRILISKWKELDKKVVWIFLSVAVLQTVSWYYTSRRFFRMNFFEDLQFSTHVYLYEYLYWFIGDFITGLILPVLIIKIFFRENLRDYGLKVGDYRAGIKLSLLFLLIMIPLVWIISSRPDFSSTYPHLNSARTSWMVFAVFESGLLLYMIGWEFIWRGFMLFGLKEKFGYYAIFIQTIPFVLLHFGKPDAEAFGSIIAGIALGILAWRTGSVFYCVITHASVMFSIDLISVLRFRSGEYGYGINSFINILSEIF